MNVRKIFAVSLILLIVAFNVVYIIQNQIDYGYFGVFIMSVGMSFLVVSLYEYD